MKHNKNILSLGVVIGLSLCAYICTTQKLLSYISYPFLKAYARIEGISYASKQKLYDELHELRQEKNKLLSENIALSAQLVFVQDTQDVLQFSRRYEDRVVATVQVLARHFSGQEQYLLLDAGKEHAIKKDMIVTHYNQLVGVVTNVFSLYSKVRLITDKQSSIGGHCFQTGEHGVVQGHNKSSMSLLYVSHTKDISVGDVVHSNGKSGLFPRGFALGKIISAQISNLYYDVTLEPLVTFSDIEYCSILRT